MEDSEIIALFFQRDQRAVEACRSRYGPLCASVANRILPTPEDGEECVNDTLFRAWNSIPPQHPKSLPGFLAALTRNLAIDRMRANTALKRGGGEIPLVLEELEEAVPAPGSVEEAVDSRLLAESISRFLRSLPEKERLLFLRRYWYLCSVKEAGALGGMSEGTASSLLRRTRNKLKKHLEKEGFVL